MKILKFKILFNVKFTDCPFSEMHNKKVDCDLIKMPEKLKRCHKILKVHSPLNPFSIPLKPHIIRCEGSKIISKQDKGQTESD